MRTTMVVFFVSALVVLSGCDNGIRQVPTGIIARTQGGVLLKPDDYYNLTDNPRVLWEDQHVVIKVKKVFSQADGTQQESLSAVTATIYIPAEKATEEVIHRVTQAKITNQGLTTLVQARADTEQWALAEGMVRNGPVSVPVIQSSTAQEHISLFDLMPELLQGR